jgi:hypothetical protein
MRTFQPSASMSEFVPDVDARVVASFARAVKPAAASFGSSAAASEPCRRCRS